MLVGIYLLYTPGKPTEFLGHFEIRHHGTVGIRSTKELASDLSLSFLQTCCMPLSVAFDEETIESDEYPLK